MEKLQELEQKLQEYQQKINELTAQISQIKAEKENEIQSIIIGKDQTLAKLNELIGGETKRPDTLKGLVQYDIGENDADVELAFIKQAVCPWH